ncbi:MAG: asparaginase [Propionibacteriales bacterium]|nr:asparaginase [Propionibacteriales bacterium]
MEPSPRPRVAVIGSGGTISSVGRNNLDIYEYLDHSHILEVDELLDRVPEATDTADVVPVRFRALSSSRLNPSDWLELNALIHDIVTKDPVDGIVVTHGTATIEETAYFLNLTLKVDVPVVLVGAMRPPSGISTDAHLNLVNAIRVAGSSAARGLGVLVALNDEVHAAREVTKTHTYSLRTFQSPDFGMLGYPDPDSGLDLYRRPVRKHTVETPFDVRGMDSLPRVDIAASYAGSDGTAIRAFAAAGANAIVAATFAPGNAARDAVDALAEAREAGIMVIFSSRAGSGRVLPREKLRAEGIVAADNLPPQKARVLAMLALTVTQDDGETQQFFLTY